VTTSARKRVVTITGATSGIGLALAEALLAHDVSVIGTGHSSECIAAARQQLAAAFPGRQLAMLNADLSLQAEVRRLADGIAVQLRSWGYQALDGLVNNAATVPYWQTLTAEGFDMQWAVNHLAPFLLTWQLLPLIEASPCGRIVTISSGSHYAGKLHWDDIQLLRRYQPLTAYNQSKLANVLFTAELKRRLGTASRVLVFAADPGLVDTSIGAKSNARLAERVWSFRRRSGISSQQAAAGLLPLLLDPAPAETDQVYWKHGHPQKPSRLALDPDSGWRLWELSARMCGVEGRRQA
jgi:retinol dehydrogenase-12